MKKQAKHVGLKSLSLCLLTGILASCQTPEVAGLTDSGGSGGGGASTTVTDVKRIVTTGPTLTFNTQTAGPSDAAINPVTKLPAIAYYDRNANVSGMAVTGALKYAYMDSYGNWNIEVVDANYGTATCGTATGFCIGAQNVAAPTTFPSILRLAFKSDGTPAIAYAYGASTATTKQIRFAERSTAGAWSVSIAFTATALVAIATIEWPMKALTLNFDSADRPHITFHFYGATINTDSKLKYLFRNSAGTWAAATDILTISTGVAVAATSGASQAGAAFCPANGKLWINAYNMTAVAGSDMTIVQSASPATDGSLSFPAGSTVAIDNGCAGGTLCVAAGASGLTTAATWGNSAVTVGRGDLQIDSAGLITLGAYAFANPGNKLLTATSSTACESMSSSFTVAPAAGFLGTAIVAANTETSPGLHGFRLAVSATDRFIAYTSNTAQEVRVSKIVAAAWFTPGLSVEGTSAALVASGTLGVAYDSTNDLLYTSYASLPAGAANALGNDIKVAYAGGADIVSAASYPLFSVTAVDQTASALPTTAIPSVSAAKAPNGTVGFALFYQDATFNDIKLYYGIRGGTTATPVFGMQNVVNYLEATAAGTNIGAYPSLVYDGGSNPVIAFYSSIATGQYMEGLQVARSGNGGAYFNVTMVDDGSPTASAAGIGLYPRAAASGTTIGVSYYDSQAANTGLKFARYTPTTGWRKYIVDGMTGATGTGCDTTSDSGKFSALKFTSAGAPVIAYQASNNLRLAYGTPATSTTYTWTCVQVDTSAATRGNGIDFELSSADLIHLVHFDFTNNQMRYVYTSTAAGTAIAAGSSAFSAEPIAFTGSITADSALPSMELTSTGTRYVSFYSALTQGLVLASKAATATSWTEEDIDADASGATFASGAGQYSSMFLNSSSLPALFYRSNENWLKYFSREEL